jgi:hypothetical protein
MRNVLLSGSEFLYLFLHDLPQPRQHGDTDRVHIHNGLCPRHSKRAIERPRNSTNTIRDDGTEIDGTNNKFHQLNRNDPFNSAYLSLKYLYEAA